MKTQWNKRKTMKTQTSDSSLHFTILWFIVEVTERGVVVVLQSSFELFCLFAFRQCKLCSELLLALNSEIAPGKD